MEPDHIGSSFSPSNSFHVSLANFMPFKFFSFKFSSGCCTSMGAWESYQWSIILKREWFSVLRNHPLPRAPQWGWVLVVLYPPHPMLAWAASTLLGSHGCNSHILSREQLCLGLLPFLCRLRSRETIWKAHLSHTATLNAHYSKWEMTCQIEQISK